MRYFTHHVAGWNRAITLGGPDPAGWQWGDLHRVAIEHPLAASNRAIAAAFPKIEGGRSGGDGQTPMARGFNARRSFNVSHGASYLFVADVGAWDNSRFLLLPGQSADPRSPRYRDLYPLMARGDDAAFVVQQGGGGSACRSAHRSHPEA